MAGLHVSQGESYIYILVALVYPYPVVPDPVCEYTYLRSKPLSLWQLQRREPGWKSPHGTFD